MHPTRRGAPPQHERKRPCSDGSRAEGSRGPKKRLAWACRAPAPPARGGRESARDRSVLVMTLSPEPAERDLSTALPCAAREPQAGRFALVALEVQRLRRAGFARVAVVCGTVVAVAFAAAVLVARHDGGGSASFASILRTAARSAAWVVGGPLALAAARDRASIELSDGIEALVATRGASRTALETARRVSAMVLGARVLGAPLLFVGVVAVAASGSIGAVLVNSLAALAVLAFAVVAGITLGAVGSACAGVGGGRGRSLLGIVVLGPWLAADLAGRTAYSIPGALDALLSMLLNLVNARGGQP